MKKFLFIFLAFVALASCTQAGNSTPSTDATNNVSATVEKATETSSDAQTQAADTHTVSHIADAEVTMGDARNIGQEAPTLGSGDHVIQIWADFQCPACQSADSSISPILEEMALAGKLKIEYRQFPLSFHANAGADAAAAMCSQDQNKYFAYKKALYALEISRAGAKLSTADYVSLAEKIGLDTQVFESCVNEGKYQDYVAQSVKLGSSLGVSGTPTYILDGKPLSMGAFRTISEFQTFMNKVVETPVQK